MVDKERYNDKVFSRGNHAEIFSGPAGEWKLIRSIICFDRDI